MLALRVEHIGSTAVPGLAAKPVIDMDVVIASAFRWPAGEIRHHLYVLITGASELQRHLAFRDALREDRAARDVYAALKGALAKKYGYSRQAYTEAKSEFISKIIDGIAI
jgi:GrpB-like predicted nucleotidyltransferase (UPF0157 family)